MPLPRRGTVYLRPVSMLRAAASLNLGRGSLKQAWALKVVDPEVRICARSPPVTRSENPHGCTMTRGGAASRHPGRWSRAADGDPAARRCSGARCAARYGRFVVRPGSHQPGSSSRIGQSGLCRNDRRVGPTRRRCSSAAARRARARVGRIPLRPVASVRAVLREERGPAGSSPARPSCGRACVAAARCGYGLGRLERVEGASSRCP